jgi:Camelysin metallo-endopeptidase.
MKKKMLFSLMTIALVGALVGGGIFAYFSDTETSEGNVFTAGTLNLKVSDDDPLTAHFAVTDTYGGDSGSDDWLLKNDGSIAGSLDITFSDIVDAENGVNEPEDADPNEDGTVAVPGTDGELAEVLHILAYIDENNDDTYIADEDMLIYDGFVKPGLEAEQLSNYAMAANYGSDGTKAVRIEWSIADTVGNKIQSDSAGFDIEFELLQEAV